MKIGIGGCRVESGDIIGAWSRSRGPNINKVHLIEGIIDEVDNTVHISWVQPRVLGIPQVKAVRERLDAWVGNVHDTLLSVEAETPDLVAA